MCNCSGGRRRDTIGRLGILTLVLLAVVLTPSWASARRKRDEDKRAEQQAELNAQAIDALIAEDYARAVELLEESLALGELNVTWLNLGRAYAKAGHCAEALDAYDRMAVAPRVEEPPPEVLYEILQGYRDELLTQCPGKVTVRCNPSDLQVSFDDAPAVACPDQPITLSPGLHVVRALQQGAVVQERVVEVEGLSVSYVELDAPPPPTVAPVETVDSTAANDVLWAVAIGSLSTGGALLVAGIATGVVGVAQEEEQLDLIEDERFIDAEEVGQQGERLVLASNILYGTGGGLLVVGTALAIAAAVVEDDDDEPTPGVEQQVGLRPALTISPQGVGLTLSTRF